jgi:hypothetical protein
MKCQLISQANSIKEYENWINILLNMVNLKDDNDNHYDIATPIQKVKIYIYIFQGLEKIQHLESDNFELKKKLIREIKKNKEKISFHEDLKSEYEMIESESNENDKEKLKREHERLLETVHSITEEVIYAFI